MPDFSLANKLSDIEINENLDMGTNKIITDAIDEKTSAHGVSIDGVLAKDNLIANDYVGNLSAGKITTGAFDDARIPSGVARDTEVDSKISTHTTNGSAHHEKTSLLSEISTDQNLAMGAHSITLDASQTVDGKDVSAMKEVISNTIRQWHGAISAIPSGYVLCDGANSTPDLTDRFIIHADADAAGTRNVGDTGGAMTHTLTTAELASHSHTLQGKATTGSGADYIQFANQYTGDLATETAGSGTSHSILNKYHALAFIMKT